MPERLNERKIVDGLLASHSRRAEVALRRALAANFTADESDGIVAAVIAGHDRTADGTPLPPGLHRFAYHLQTYELRHGSDAQTVTFWPEDFFAFFFDLAVASGVDIDRFSRTLSPAGAAAGQSVARALVTVAELEHIYVETGGALTETRVPRQFLYVVAAALIGMASSDLSTVRGAVTGALSGASALLVELLADRYFSGSEPTTDFLDDLVLRIVEQHGPMSARELHDETHIESALLQRALKRLLAKRLLRRLVTYTNGKTYRYDLMERP